MMTQIKLLLKVQLHESSHVDKSMIVVDLTAKTTNTPGLSQHRMGVTLWSGEILLLRDPM